MSDGWIKLHREIEFSSVFRDGDVLRVWIYILLHAVHKPIKYHFCGREIILEPGQFVTGSHRISEDLALDRSKVRRIIKRLKSDHQIDHQKGNKGSIITVVNWDRYQNCDHQSDHQVTIKRPSSDHQVTTKEEYKKERKKECKKKEAPQAALCLPNHLNTPEANEALTKWLKYKAEQFNFHYKTAGVNQFIADITGKFATSDAFIKGVNHSIAAGYKGLFPSSGNGGRPQQTQFLSRYERQMKMLKEKAQQKEIQNDNTANGETLESYLGVLPELPNN